MSSFKAGKTGDMPEKGKKATITRGGPGKASSGESAGVGSGLSERYACNVDENEPKIDFKRNSLTGNATERIKPRGATKASKNGKSFDIET